MHISLMSSFVTTMIEYQEIQDIYEEKARQNLMTRIRLKNPHATEVYHSSIVLVY